MINEITTYLDQVSSLVLKIPADSIERITAIILKAYTEDRTIFVFGNGGGSATSAHFVCDLAKGTAAKGRKRLRALSLADNMPLLMLCHIIFRCLRDGMSKLEVQ